MKHQNHLEAAFGVEFDPDMLKRALTHRSYAYENGGLPTNERLEFLGDAVLGVVITTALFQNHPKLAEGQLAKLRASVVNMRALADVARRLGPAGIGPFLLLGKGEEATGGRDKASILADTLEALIGAIYLQYGLDTTAQVIHKLFDGLMAEAALRGAGLDWKTSLQELTAGRGLGVPEYRIDEEGPDHAKRFTAWVIVAKQRYGGEQGGSKKEAEQRAAEAAWRELSGVQPESSATPPESRADATPLTAGSAAPLAASGSAAAPLAASGSAAASQAAAGSGASQAVSGSAASPGVVSGSGASQAAAVSAASQALSGSGAAPVPSGSGADASRATPGPRADAGDTPPAASAPTDPAEEPPADDDDDAGQ